MKKITFEKINASAFKTLDSAQMKRIKGGYTLNTVTITPGAVSTFSSTSVKGKDDGDDGITND